MYNAKKFTAAPISRVSIALSKYLPLLDTAEMREHALDR